MFSLNYRDVTFPATAFMVSDSETVQEYGNSRQEME